MRSHGKRLRPISHAVRVGVGLLGIAQLACGGEPRTAYAMAQTGPRSYGLVAYQLSADGGLTSIQEISTAEAEPWVLALHPSGRWLYLVESRRTNPYGYLRSFRIDAAGRLSAFEEHAIEDGNESPWDVVMTMDTLYLEIDGSGTGESHRIRHYAIDEEGRLIKDGALPACSRLPPSSTTRSEGSSLVPGRNGVVWLLLSRRAVIEKHVVEQPPRTEGLDLAAEPASLRLVSPISALAVHPTEPLIYADQSGALVSYDTRLATQPASLTPVHSLQRGADDRAISLAVHASGAWLFASTRSGIETFAIGPGGRLSPLHRIGTESGILVADPEGEFLYITTDRPPGSSRRPPNNDIFAYRVLHDGSLLPLGRAGGLAARARRGAFLVRGIAARCDR